DAEAADVAVDIDAEAGAADAAGAGPDDDVSGERRRCSGLIGLDADGIRNVPALRSRHVESGNVVAANPAACPVDDALQGPAGDIGGQSLHDVVEDVRAESGDAGGVGEVRRVAGIEHAVAPDLAARGEDVEAAAEVAVEKVVLDHVARTSNRDDAEREAAD